MGAISEKGDQLAAEAVIARLEDEDPKIRAAAAESLGNLFEKGDRHLVRDDGTESIENVLEKGNWHSVKALVAQILAARLEVDGDPNVRATVAVALGSISEEGDERSIEAFA